MVNIAVKNTNIKTAFPPFKVGDLFSVKNSLPKYPKYFIVYRFTCPGCNASDIGETTHHLSKRFKEHLKTDSKSHIFKHLSINRNCKELCDAECFYIMGSATSFYLFFLRLLLSFANVICNHS